MKSSLPCPTPRSHKVSSPPCKIKGSFFPHHSEKLCLDGLKKIINFFKSKPIDFYIPNDPLIIQAEELKRKAMEHRYWHLFLCALLMLNNGCGDWDLWPKKELLKEHIQELPDTEDPVLLEKINGLPSISVIEDQNFRSQNTDDNFWKIDANNRSLFYNQNEIKIAKFYLENPSSENLKLRFSDIVLQGSLNQYLNKFHVETMGTVFNDFQFKSEIYRSNKIIDLSSYIRVVLFDQNKKVLSLDKPLEIKPHEKLLGYVTIDFFSIPKCELPAIQSYQKNGWDFYTQYDLYRLIFNLSFGFSVQKSLSGQNENFYLNDTHWVNTLSLVPAEPHHESDYVFYWRRGHNHTAQSLHDVSQEHDIPELGCVGLY